MSKIINALFFVLFITFMSVVMFEWVSGCGQTWIDAQGVEHIGQCWLIK